MQLRKRYPSLYIPSDFADVSIEWPKTTPIENPISISTAPITYHVLHKDIDCPSENVQVLNPPDADYRFSVKVILLHLFYLRISNIRKFNFVTSSRMNTLFLFIFFINLLVS